MYGNSKYQVPRHQALLEKGSIQYPCGTSSSTPSPGLPAPPDREHQLPVVVQTNIYEMKSKNRNKQ